MSDKSEAPDVFKWFSQMVRSDQEELRLWRKCYPHRAPFLAEEARSKVEGRKPSYPPAVIIG